jgi:hypothetical protein
VILVFEALMRSQSCGSVVMSYCFCDRVVSVLNQKPIDFDEQEQDRPTMVMLKASLCVNGETSRMRESESGEKIASQLL